MSSEYIEISLEKESLRSLIEKDKKKSGISHGRFPVRFILINSFDEIKTLLDIFRKKEVEILDLSNCEEFKNKDRWLSRYELIDIIKKLPEEGDYIIVPIWEFLRFFDDNEFYSFLTSLMDIENSNFKRRIYIPILGLFSRFQNSFFNKYHRRYEFTFVWRIVGEHFSKHNLIFLNFPIKSENFTVVYTTKEFLDLWKKDYITPNILISSEILYYFSDKGVDDEVFSLRKIKNIKEFIEEILKIKIPIEYNDSEIEFWKTLLENISGKNSFEDFVKEHLNVMYLEDFSRINPLSLWLDKEKEFTRWLIKGYYSNINNNCYTKVVFSSLSNLSTEEALKKYYLKIFEGKFDNKFLEERRKIIQNALKDRDLDLKNIEDALKDKISSLSSKEIVKYLTGTTFFEKKWIIENIDSVEDLENLYPELYFYLREDIDYQELKEENYWIKEYFQEYRNSRVKNFLSPKLRELLNEKNQNSESFYKWYFSFEPFKNYIEEKGYEKIWIDGLGLEFLPLIVSLLEQEGFKVNFKVARANLPSTTEFNNLQDIPRISDLDNFIHNQYSYVYPDNLIKEIEIIKKIVKNKIRMMEKVMIFSDHGFTAFANIKFEGRKIIGIKVSEREGRYAEIIDERIPEDEDFLVYYCEEDGKKYLIALKYKFFSETSYKETHGGATPEEVLVPVIYASKVKEILEKEKYEIELLKREIEIRDPILKVKIKPKPKEKVIFFMKNKKLQPDVEKEIYILNLSGYKAGDYILTVKIGSYKEDIRFKIKGGLKERDLL